MMVMGILFGGLTCLIPALLKAKWTTSETLVTLMLNYVAQKFITYLQYGPWKDPHGIGFPKIADFSQNAILPFVFKIHSGWIITIVLVFIVWFIIKRTKLGYEIDVLGESQATARYAGMNVTAVLIIAAVLSGGLCGMAGAIQASAIEQSLSDQIAGGIGFTAVITTWLARMSPPAALVVCFLFSMLIQGGNYLQASMSIPSAITSVIQAVIIFFVIGGEFFLRYRIVFGRAKK
jgi:simple sugar transport system permease protein